MFDAGSQLKQGVKEMRLVDLKIQDVAFGGKGVARKQGKAVFVPYTMEDELVSAEIVREKKQFAEAEPIEVKQNSPTRVAPECPYFGRCGGCARLPLSSCICHWAEEKRAELRAEMAAGKSINEIQDDFAKQYGVKAISIPRDKGLDRALWAVPIGAFVLAAGGLTYIGRKWVKRGRDANAAAKTAVVVASADARDNALDRELDEELRRLDEA